MKKETNRIDMDVNDQGRRLSTWFPVGGQESVLTGWRTLDWKLGGLRNGEVIVVSGYSGIGKTTFVTNLIKNISVGQGIPTLFFSFQLPEYMVAKSLLSSMSGLDLNSQLTTEEQVVLRKQTECLGQAPIYLNNADLDAELLGTTAVDIAKANGVKAIFIDGLRNVCRSRFGKSEVEEIFQILKAAAIELNVPIVITDTCKVAHDESGLNSLPYYPCFDHTSYDPVFDACDVMLVLHRPELFGATEDNQGRNLRNLLAIGIEKNSQGTKDMVSMSYDFAIKTIKPIETDSPLVGM